MVKPQRNLLLIIASCALFAGASVVLQKVQAEQSADSQGKDHLQTSGRLDCRRRQRARCSRQDR